METPEIQKAITHLRRKDPLLRSVMDRVGPLEFRAGSDPFTHLCREILGQQLSGKVADAIHGRFRALYPRRKILRPSEVLATPHGVLRSCGMSNAKAAFLKDLAQKFSDGTINPKIFKNLSDEDVSAELKKVKGIGQWTADMFLMFGLGRSDVFPVQDLGIRKGMRKLYSLRSLPTPERMQKIAAPWIPYRTIATRYIWQYLDGEQGDY